MKIRTLIVLLGLICFLGLPVAQAQHDAKMDKGAMKGKHVPPRDPKTGRFMKKSDKGGKKMPARDPKTGRFMKSDTGGKMSAKGGKKMPPRDAKGRFMKSDKGGKK
jgi:hypothetical protein